jgi:mono/diheme cytochrome c family protein
VGPSLDGAGLDSDEVASIVSEGRGTMPAFSGDLDDAEIDAIAQFVADSSGS